MSYRKPLFIIVLCVVLLAPISNLQASGLSTAQVAAIISVLRSFGADESVITKVQTSLSGTATIATSTTSSVSTQPAATISTVADCPVYKRSLSEGSNGADVTVLQKFLVAAGYLPATAVTGYFDADTTLAVKQWQSANDIVSGGTAETTGFGVVGTRTVDSLYKACVASLGTSTTSNTIPAGNSGISFSANYSSNTGLSLVWNAQGPTGATVRFLLVPAPYTTVGTIVAQNLALSGSTTTSVPVSSGTYLVRAEIMSSAGATLMSASASNSFTFTGLTTTGTSTPAVSESLTTYFTQNSGKATLGWNASAPTGSTVSYSIRDTSAGTVIASASGAVVTGSYSLSTTGLVGHSLSAYVSMYSSSGGLIDTESQTLNIVQ